MPTNHCKDCQHGDHFISRKDEIERYGLDVMGCQRLNYEGYTTLTGTCEAWRGKQEDIT